MIASPLPIACPDDLFDREFEDSLPEWIDEIAIAPGGSSEPPLDDPSGDPHDSFVGSTHSAGDKPDLVSALYRRLLCPNPFEEGDGCACVFAEFEMAQLRAVLGDLAPTDPSFASVERSLRQPAAQARLRSVIDEGEWFERSGRPFLSFPYERPNFLEYYLTYYGSRNLLQVQLALAEIFREGRLPRELRVLDLGVGPGTTAVALFEFLRRLGEACEETATPFPVDHAQVFGIDRSAMVMDFARRFVGLYAQQLCAAESAPPDTVAYPGYGYRVANWACAGMQGMVHDLRSDVLPRLPFEPTLIVAGNSLSEISLNARRLWGSIEAAFDQLSRGGFVLVIENPVWRRYDRLADWACATLARRPNWEIAGVLHDAPAAVHGTNRAQTFVPHGLFRHVVSRVPSIAPDYERHFAPVNRGVHWTQVTFHRP